MQFILDNWYLFAAAAVSGALLAWPLITRGTHGGRVTTSEAVRLINRERALLIDVSDATEFAAGHPGGARSVPLATLEKSTALPKNKSLPIVVVCSTGPRAARAAATLRKMGFENARPLAGGLAAWREANLPIEKSA